MPLRIFISHASADIPFADSLANDLRRAGADAWLDASHIGPGDFVARISEALNSRDVLVLVLSPAALGSAWVPAEMNAAIVRHQQGFMQPPVVVLAEPVPLREIPALWSTYHRVDATGGYAKALPRILRALELTMPPAPTEPPPTHVVAAPLPPPSPLELPPVASLPPVPFDQPSADRSPVEPAPVDQPRVEVAPGRPKPSQNVPARGTLKGLPRNLLLGALAVVLVLVSLGVLLDHNAQASANLSRTETAGVPATDAAKLSTELAHSKATSTVSSEQTATATILNTPHFPYRAAAPGPICDRGLATWSSASSSVSSVTHPVQCHGTYTHLISAGIEWNDQPNNLFPQNYTLSVQVSNLSAQTRTLVSVMQQNGWEFDIEYDSSGGLITSYCNQIPGVGCPQLGVNVISATGVHTLAINRRGTKITYLVDNSPVNTYTEPTASPTYVILLEVQPTCNCPEAIVSADFANFSMG